MPIEITHRIVNGQDAIDTVTVFAIETTPGGDPIWRSILYTREPWVIYRHIGDTITLIPMEYAHMDSAHLPANLPAVRFNVSTRPGMRLGIYADQNKCQIHAMLIPQSVHAPTSQ